ncbi:MAG: universal stress protein [Chloroflexota bacterium]|jgi:nucleotide-binding universal stress UspA family protein
MYMEVVRKDQYTLLCVHRPPVSDEWVAYTSYIGNLLDSRPIHQGFLEPFSAYQSSTTVTELSGENSPQSIWLTEKDQEDYGDDMTIVHPSECDLVVIMDKQPLGWQRLLKRILACHILKKIPGSILFAHKPRWPLHHILIVVRAHETDELALKWVERLAVPSEAKITLMPIVPPYPRLHQNDVKINEGIDALMAPNTYCGEALHRYVRRLDQLNLQGTVCWKQGNPEHQIRREVRDTNHDLIVIAGEPFGRFSRWFLGELVGPLLGKSDRPVLIAR